MDERLNKVASLSNLAFYDAEVTKAYIDGAPHVKHASLRLLYAKLLVNIYEYGAKYADALSVLDLGAGEGSTTLPFLELGAKVTAVDISSSQIDALRNKSKKFGDMIELRCEDINETLQRKNQQYDIIVANSFLHHIPDYLSMIKQSITLLKPHGQFFSFQDQLRYDTVGKFSKAFSDFSFFAWRIFQRDFCGGVRRYIRRKRGIYLLDSIHDNTEYHFLRNGVDQDAIADFFRKAGFICNIILYFSTHSWFLQYLGSAMGLTNTFAIIARRDVKDNF